MGVYQALAQTPLARPLAELAAPVAPEALIQGSGDARPAGPIVPPGLKGSLASGKGGGTPTATILPSGEIIDCATMSHPVCAGVEPQVPAVNQSLVPLPSVILSPDAIGAKDQSRKSFIDSSPAAQNDKIAIQNLELHLQDLGINTACATRDQEGNCQALPLTLFYDPDKQEYTGLTLFLDRAARQGQGRQAGKAVLSALGLVQDAREGRFAPGSGKVAPTEKIDDSAKPAYVRDRLDELFDQEFQGLSELKQEIAEVVIPNYDFTASLQRAEKPQNGNYPLEYVPGGK
ncbi:MAG: hypothetical protein AABZ44_01225, partial [Elusimicrobiota bacterium]